MNDEGSRGDGAGADSQSGEAASIVRANPDTRRRALVGLVALTLVLGALLYLVVLRLERLQTESAANPRAAVRQLAVLLWATAGLVAAMAIAMAATLARLAARVRRAERYPVPGALVLRDTPVRTGAEALRFATLSLVLAGLLAVAAVAALVTAWWLSRILGW